MLQKSDLDDDIAKAQAATARRDWTAALDLWQIISRRFPDRPDGFVGMAGVLVELGRIGEAEGLLDETMERFPSDLWGAVLYAEIPRRARNSREGLRRWELVHKNFPDAAVSHVGIGSALRDIGEFDTAETAFAKATERFPTDLWAAHNYAEIAGRRGDWAEALRRWERVRQGFPEHASAHVGAADALLKLERYEEADQLLSHASDAFPMDYWGLVSYARLAARQHRWDEAIRRWDVALQRFPCDAAAHIGKAEALIQAGRFSEAEVFLKASIERFPAETHLSRLGSEIADRRRAAGRVNTSEERAAILDELARIRAIAGEDQSLLIRAIYAEVQSLASPPPEITEQLNTHFAALGELIPHKSTECVQFCERLALSDIERVCLLSVGLKHARENAVWLHYALAAALNNLLLSGQLLARGPCLLHSFLAIMNSAGGRDNEPLPRSILARELAAFAPRDAIREGLEAMLLWPAAPNDAIQIASRQLNLLPELDGFSEPDILHVQAVAEACGLPLLRNLRAVSRLHASDISERTAFEAETRERRIPRGDSNYFREAGKPIALPAIRVYAIPGGTVSFDVSRRGGTQFYVFDSREFCISELSCGVAPFISEQRIDVKGQLGILSDIHSSAMNICHFLLDNLTRIPIYRRCHGNDVRFLLAGDYPYYREILELSGLEASIVRPETARFSVRAELLLVSSNIVQDFCHPGHLCAEWALNFLRTLLPSNSDTKSVRKFSISRADAAGRKPINEEQVQQALRARGFDVVTLSGRSARDQIELFASASHVVGVHGAGLTNVLFSPPDTRVLEVLPPMVATEAYWTLCSQLRHRYSCLIADDPEYPRPDYSTWQHRPEYNRRNIILPIDSLVEAIEAMDD